MYIYISVIDTVIDTTVRALDVINELQCQQLSCILQENIALECGSDKAEM